MRIEEVWRTEHIEWWSPGDRDGFRDAIGATSQQLEGRTDCAFSFMRFVPPKCALEFIDPCFEPGRHGRETITFLKKAIKDGLLVAPAQVWVTPTEAAYFPEIAWMTKRADILRKVKMARRELTDRECQDLVMPHEGRHRLWFADHIGETVVPVQLWVALEDEEAKREARRTVETLKKKVCELEADVQELQEALNRAG